MEKYLLFRMHGPLASWGGIAVGEVRASDNHPSKSAILGLLAAALGIRRQEEDALTTLADGYAFAVRVDGAGVLLRDYHTVQVPSASDMKGRPQQCRRDQLAVPREKLNTLLTTREYRCDALYTVAITARAMPPHTLEQLVAALEQPRFILYMGRKSCPLSLPLQAQVVEATNLAVAFGQGCFAEESYFREQGRDWGHWLWSLGKNPTLYWEEGGDEEGLTPLMTIVRRDHPLHRRRWQFAQRQERQGRMATPERVGE